MRYRFHLTGPLLAALVLLACKSDEASTSPDGGGGSPGGSASGSGGHLFGPVGSQLGITLGAETVTPAISAASPGAVGYGSSRFDFQQALAAGATYSVTAGAAPANQTCRIYQGESGTAPIADGALRAGCEWTFDLVSRSTDNRVTTGADYSSQPAIGGADVAIGGSPARGDGRFVAFRSTMAGLAGNTNGSTDIFWRDRLTGETRLVSKGTEGKGGNGISDQPAISGDGLTVAFRSAATNLVENDANESTDIFVWKIDLANGAETFTRASVGPAGTEANASSTSPTLSGDGTILAFGSSATNIAEGAGDSTLNEKVLRRDLTAGTNVIVTFRPNGNVGTGGSPMLSEDGNRIVYYSFGDLAGDVATYMWDIFVYEHSTNKSWPVTLGPDGAAKNQGGDSVSGVTMPSISGDGKWVAFSTAASNLAAGFDDKQSHVYVVEVDKCTTTGCNIKPADMTPDGAASDAGILSHRSALSHDGRAVVFTSASPNLGGQKGVTNVYVYERETQKTRRLTNIESTYSADPWLAISRNGAYVGFGCRSVLDPRFADTTGYGGLYALFTGTGHAFAWPTGPLAP